MAIAVFWFNFFAFTLMFGTFGLAWICWQRGRELHRAIYMAYIACYSLWSLALNFVFFSVNLMEQPDLGLAAVLVWIRLAISLVVGWLAPLLLYSLGPGRLRRRHALLALLLPALTVAVVFLLGNYPLALKLFTGLFNGGLGLASLLVLFFRLEKNEFRGFLLVHGVILCLYGLFGLATIPWPAIAPSELT
ncbi:MAG: hypothetical protein D6B26_07120, partial [Spirochaetaceae bacterium]